MRWNNDRGGRCILATVLLAAAWVAPGAAWAVQPGPRPNIIFILVDDVGMGWYSCYGSSHQTPNIDRLAAQGVRFENAWCAPMCTPSRMEFLTGQYPFRSGWTVHYDVPRWGGAGFDPARYTSVARVMRQAGYATAIAGKWQLNDLRTDTTIMNKHGFDQYCLWTGVETGNPDSSRRYWNPYLEINGRRNPHPDQYGPDIIQKFALEFIRNHRDKPFFLYYPMLLAHAPLEPVPGPDGRPRANLERQGLMADTISYIDRQIGELTALLDSLGLSKNTVVVFTGDNGTAGDGGTRNGKPLPGVKGKVSDLGVHVPFIVRAPMVVNKPLVSSALIDFTDLFPTCVELAGTTLPAGVTFDGRSLVPVLSGAAVQGKPWLVSQLGKQRIVRDERWLLHVTRGRFFDLLNDPLEQQDLQQSKDPEVVAARQRLAGIMAALPDDAPSPFAGYEQGGKKKNKSKKATATPK